MDPRCCRWLHLHSIIHIILHIHLYAAAFGRNCRCISDYQDFVLCRLHEGQSNRSDLAALVSHRHLAGALITFVRRERELQLAALHSLRAVERYPRLGGFLDFNRVFGIILYIHLECSSFRRNLRNISYHYG